MDLINSIKKDKAYMKYKLTVKTWEKDFIVKYSRTPSKLDIKEAPPKIKYAYKQYFQLKSNVLENSLSLCDLDVENLAESPSPSKIETSELECLSSSELSLPSLPSGQELNELLTEPIQNGTNGILHPITQNLSKKLFQNRKFSVRNPRKLSLTKSQSTIEETDHLSTPNINGSDNLNDKLLFQSNTNYSVINNENISSDVLNLQDPLFVPTSVRQLDTAWLQRAVGLPITDDKSITVNHEKSKFGLRNISLTSNDIKTTACNDYVENSESEEDIDKLKPALKKRKIENIPLDKKIQTEKGKSKNSQSVLHEKQSIPKKSKSVETFTEQPPDIHEFVPFPSEVVAPRHSVITNILKTIDSQSSAEPLVLESDKLEIKARNGTINENFVKINIEKKVFVRGKKSMNFSKYKKQQYKNKKKNLVHSAEFPESGKITCFKCGETGHMARYCRAHKGDNLMPLENCEEPELPSLDDIQNIVNQNSSQCFTLSEQLTQSIYKPNEVPESFMKLLSKSSPSCDPVYSSYETVDNQALTEVLNMFEYTSFKPGQEQAIKRILCGMSTLLILSTGGGKSLCYQIPAYLYSKSYKCITLVISPLVSLMEDQVLNMPQFLKAACLHTNQPPSHRQKIIQLLKEGDINILLISPEALISGDSSNGFTGLFKSLPPIAFACIDEAHCVSHWSHNFRPSYLMISRVLREKLNVNCILGLTATASQPTISNIIDHLHIPDGTKGVITIPLLPDNLQLSVSFEKDKDKAIISLLTSDRFINYNSIVVYCIRRDECERIAALLRSYLQEVGKYTMEKIHNRKRKRTSYTAEAYHAGLSAAQRKKIQKLFIEGTLRIIVATVAFGMGINKPDIRCIIHYNMPSSFESYVQEVGRAGRDAKPAVCHTFINSCSNDVDEILKHIYANYIDRSVVRKLLQKVFIPCDCSTSKSISCKGHEVGIPVDKTVEELDLPSENITTLLCYIELHPKEYIKVLNNAYMMCKISSYGGPQKLLEGAKSCQPLAMAYLMESKRDPSVLNHCLLEFNVIEVAAAIGWESGMTKYQLKNLEWICEGGASKRSHLKVEFHTLGYRIRAKGDLSPAELDGILDDLFKSVKDQERARLFQLEECNKTFRSLGNYSVQSSDTIDELFLKEKSNKLKEIIGNYFLREKLVPDDIDLGTRPLDEEKVRNDVRALITSYKDCTFSGRNVAKIFQGIPSPNFPALVWGRCRFWRSHIHEDFNGLIRIATQEIIQLRM